MCHEMEQDKMILIFFVSVIIFVFLVIVAIKTKGKVKKMALSVIALFILISAVFLVLVRPAQQGKIFPVLGNISLLLFEPQDLWTPLAEEILNNKTEYNFSFRHKYVGNHSIEILFSNKEIDPWKIDTEDLGISVKFYKNSDLIFSKSNNYVGAFLGLRGKGLTYLQYSVPDNVPISQELNVTINVIGNIKDFLKKYGDAKIIIRKGSDL